MSKSKPKLAKPGPKSADVKKANSMLDHLIGKKISLTVKDGKVVDVRPVDENVMELAKPVSIRQEILETGIALTTGDRQKTYGEAFDNMRHFARLLTAYFSDKLAAPSGIMVGGAMTRKGFEFSAEDAAQIMVLAKASRVAGVGPFHKDNYIDQATYSAIAGECRARETV